MTKMIIHILHKKDGFSPDYTYILCKAENTEEYFVYTEEDWTYKDVDGSWFAGVTPTCEACIFLALANPEDVLQADFFLC